MDTDMHRKHETPVAASVDGDKGFPIPMNPNYQPPPPMNPQYPQHAHPQAFTGYATAPQVTTIIVGTVPLGSMPMSMQCPHCHQQISTAIAPKSGLLTWLLCGGLVLFGCWLCCCIPFCLISCQDLDHICPSCRKYIGTYRRI